MIGPRGLVRMTAAPGGEMFSCEFAESHSGGRNDEQGFLLEPLDMLPGDLFRSNVVDHRIQ